VQRLPVRVELDQQELRAHPLRIGLSMQADVDIKNESGNQLSNAQNTVYQTNVFDKYGEQADAEIARIIAENAGSSAGLAQQKQPAAAAGAQAHAHAGRAAKLASSGSKLM
jgi:membrane fusion protein (multidrug efflux system)